MEKKCSGCGIILQTKDKNKDGYVDNLDKDLCYRCFRQKHYNEYQEANITNIDNILNNIKDNDLVVYISNILNLNIDYLNKFKRVILVLTKRDILPKSIIDDKIKNYIKKNNHNLIDIHIVSSINNYNIDNLYNSLLKHNITNNIYFIGNTSSGKSTLINKIISNYTDIDKDITTSMYPNTTLELINIKINNINYIDTPGLINKGSILNYIDSKIIKRINPKKEIKPLTYQLTGTGSLLIDDLVRIDYNCNKTSITVYINNGIPVKKINSNRNDLKEHNKKSFSNLHNEDIVIEDLCFIKFTNYIDLDIYTYNNVLITRRDNLI